MSVHFAEARQMVHDVGWADRLIEVPAYRYQALFDYAMDFIHRDEEAGELSRAAHRLQFRLSALDSIMGELMTAKDNLREAVDEAANEMTKAAEFIKNHPAAANDPELQSWADRLHASAQALAGADVEQATGDTGSGATGATGATGSGG